MTSARTRARMVERLRAQGIRDPRVLEAIGAVPRHLFLEEALAHRAYEDTALPIGFGQTISQPYAVARMIEVLLEGRARDGAGGDLGKVLEVGTGCGYQAAVLGMLAREVISVEIVAALARDAAARLARLGYANVHVRHEDGHRGAPDAAPFDAVLVAAAPGSVPQALIEQLAPGGRLVVPVGSAEQELRVYRRTDGEITMERVCGVAFVPMTGGG
jgi:protein-L-isoaspartate(D-aspartate) O-methyltransferase